MQFEILLSEVQRDVAAAQALPPSSPSHAYAFRVEENLDAHRFDVLRSPADDPRVILRRVTFFMVDPGLVRVRDAENKHVTTTNMIARWNAEEAACQLEIDGTAYPPWKISQKLLEPLFFDPPQADVGGTMEEEEREHIGR